MTPLARLGLWALVLAAMTATATAIHLHAWATSHEDTGCVGNCDGAERCHCGWSYALEHPLPFLGAAAMLVGGATYLSLQATRGRARGRLRRAIALAGVAYLAIAPLGFDLSDWHGETPFFLGLLLLLMGFPLNVPLLFGVSGSGDEKLPYLGGDPTYGRFSTTVAVGLLTAGAFAYLQWMVVVPWLCTRLRRRWSARPPPAVRSPP